jgi:hypothetical protein
MRTPVAIALLLAATTAVAEDLPTFLAAATAAARPNAPVRADGELVTASPDGSAHDQIAVVRRPNGDTYLELRNSGVRALLLADGHTALLVPGAGQATEAFALDASFGNSEFTREDLRSFNAADYRSPTIVDRGADDMTVSLTPQQSQYVLQVITFDREKKVPLVVKDYKDAISNLVKMRRNRALRTAGGTWLPGEMTMENFPMRTTSTVTLRWQPTADAPALFDPAALAKPSTLTWPAAVK